MVGGRASTHHLETTEYKFKGSLLVFKKQMKGGYVKLNSLEASIGAGGCLESGGRPT